MSSVGIGNNFLSGYIWKEAKSNKGNGPLTHFNKYRHCLFEGLLSLENQRTASVLKEFTVLESRCSSYLLLHNGLPWKLRQQPTLTLFLTVVAGIWEWLAWEVQGLRRWWSCVSWWLSSECLTEAGGSPHQLAAPIAGGLCRLLLLSLGLSRWVTS